MQVRSLNSSVHKWPDRAAVESALQIWARSVLERDDVTRVGFFGSYARGDWGVGSDVDVVVVLTKSSIPFQERSLALPGLSLPVSADLVVYTEAELQNLADTKFGEMIAKEAIWLGE